jgi:AcrR family transcriptional regulator
MSSSKTRILDAAERIVLRQGAAHLTLDAVAAETGISKGGLLYHFRSKDELVRGMIRRLLEQFNAEVARLESCDPCPTGRRVRAMLNANFPQEPSETSVHNDRVAAALLAAVATNPALLDDLRESTRRMEHAMLNDGLDPVTAMVVHMAADGIWMSRLFGIPHPSGELRDQVVDRLRVISYGTEKSEIVTCGT